MAELDLTRILETKLYGDLSSRSSNCGRKIELTNTNNGKSVSVVVADACPTCLHEDDLDLSFAAFTSIATEEEGEVPSTFPLVAYYCPYSHPVAVTWRFVN